MNEFSLLIDLHRHQQRQGPGGVDETRKAINLTGLQSSFQPSASRSSTLNQVDIDDPDLDERERVIAALEQVGWVQAKAARLLGLTPRQLELIISHELAHVARLDYLFNLAQIAVETLFFFHPAVWWLSGRIRAERENCCDDLAVTAIENRVEYGRALLAIAELRGPDTVLGLGADDGSLLSRVRRLGMRALRGHRAPSACGGGDTGRYPAAGPSRAHRR